MSRAMTGTPGLRGRSPRPRASRGEVVAFSVGSWLVLFALLPWALGRRGRKAGWRADEPGLLNRTGLLVLAFGAGGLGWCLASHYSPGETIPVSLVPENLIRSGPYRFSRNPMYVSEQLLLLGWAVYFGSPALLGGSGVLAGLMRYAVGREERTLRREFGASWEEYANRVPRWI